MEEGGGGGLTAHQIYMAMTGGPGSSSLDIARDAAAAEAELQEARAERIMRIAQKIQAGWQGSAADGAYGATAPAADVVRADADQLTTAQNLLGTQSEVFNSIKNSVRPVPEKPPGSNILNDMVPWETDLDREIKQYQADAEHNLAVYGMYDGESLSNQQRLPREFPALVDPGGDISVRSPGDTPGGPGGGPSGPPPPKPGGGDMGTYSGGGSGGGGPAAPPAGSSGGQGSSQGTGASEFVPAPVNPPGVQPPPNVPPGGPPPGTGPGPIAPVVPIGGGYSGGRGPGFGAGPDSGRGGAGSGGPGARGGAGEGGAGGRGPGGVVGRGPGAGLGGLSAEEAAARRGGAVGARGGAAGIGGLGALGAGRGQGGEDTEHERKSFLQEPDPEAIFGTDELTAPPVIGEDE